MVLAAARGGDSAAVQALREVGRHLGIGVASLVNALNPDLVVLGGRLSAAGEFLLPVAKAELQGRALRWNAEATQVVLAKHGADACVMGGVAAVTQAVLAEPGLATGPWAERPGSERGRGKRPAKRTKSNRTTSQGESARVQPPGSPGGCRAATRRSLAEPRELGGNERR